MPADWGIDWDERQKKDARLKVVRLWIHTDDQATVMGEGRTIPKGFGGKLVDVLVPPPYAINARSTYYQTLMDVDPQEDLQGWARTERAKLDVREVKND